MISDTIRQSVAAIRSQLDVIEAVLPPDPVDCVWGEWSAFGAWSAWLDNGDGTESRMRTRTRTVAVEAAHGGAPCEGPSEETETETRPIAVDCVLSDWALQSAGVWSACQPNGTRSKRERWTRTVVTEPAHGGAACGPLEEFRDVSEACVYVPPPPPPPPTGEHARFDAIVAMDSMVAAFGMRNEAEIQAMSSRGVIERVHYSPEHDAAQWTFAAGSNGSGPGFEQLRPVIGLGTGTVALGWEAWNSPEMRSAVSCPGGAIGLDDAGVGAYQHKAFQFAFGSGPNAGDITLELQYKYTRNTGTSAGALTCDDSCLLGVRYYGKAGQVPGQTDDNSYLPSGPGTEPPVSFPIRHSRWTHFVAEMRLNRPGAEFAEWSELALGGAPLEGTWHMASVWVRDKERGWTRILYRVPVGAAVRPFLSQFYFEFNSSSKPGVYEVDAAICTRNLWVLHDYTSPGATALVESDPLIFPASIEL